MAEGEAWRAASQRPRFAATKFRPTTLPATLVTRLGLRDRLTAGAGQRLTVVVGSAGAGKSVLLSSWVAARPSGATSWLSCDEADSNPVRFWTGFVEASQGVSPGFGADAADLLAMDSVMSADVTASIANDAAKLPAGSAIVVDDFHNAAPAVAGNMTDLVERWPAQNAQLVLASRVDPPLRLHRLRMSGELCELRDRDLYFTLAESSDLLAGFGVALAPEEQALLHQRSEGWAAALQMAALSLRGTKDPLRATRALDVRGHAIAGYFVSEVLEQQPPEVIQFMLDTSVLGELTADGCAAVTGRQDASALLRSIDAANLFLVPADDERTTFRYHHLVRQVLSAELRARDRPREQALQLRAAEWLESAGDTRQASRHFLAARQVDRALSLLQDRVAADFLRDPALPAPLDLSMVALAGLDENDNAYIRARVLSVRAQAQRALDMHYEAYGSLQAHNSLRSHHTKIATYWNSVYKKLSETLAELRVTRATLESRTQELERLSLTDALTGLPNRRHLYERAAIEIERTRRANGSLAIALFDVDHFKKVNDTYGHETGDSVLKSVARAASGRLRSGDFLARLGGEEFAVLIPYVDFHEAAAVTERLRQSIAQSKIMIDGVCVHVTASFGVTRFELDSDSFDKALSRADDLCYSAKRAGRNSVHESG